MEILYAIAIAGVIGIVLRFILPGRVAYGIALTPAIAAAVAAAAWGVLAWIGWNASDGAIWAISLGGGFVAALLTAIVAPPARRRADEQFFERARRA